MGGSSFGQGWPRITRGSAGRVLNHCSSQADHRRQTIENFVPRLALIVRAKKLTTTGADVNSCGIEAIRRHGIAQNSFVGEFLGQTAQQGLPRGTGIARAIDAQAAVAGATKLLRLDRNDIGAVGISGMHEHGKTKIRGQSVANVGPALAAVVGAIDPPMILQE